VEQIDDNANRFVLPYPMPLEGVSFAHFGDCAVNVTDDTWFFVQLRIVHLTKFLLLDGVAKEGFKNMALDALSTVGYNPFSFSQQTQTDN
jgi:hypothetical protein